MGICRYNYCYNGEETKAVHDLYERVKKDWERNKGFVYVKFIKGQKTGSIAKLVFDLEPLKEKDFEQYSRVANARVYMYTYIEFIADGKYRWTGRGNKPKGSLTDRNIEWLEGYTGDTVWNVIPADKEKEEALKEPTYDMDNKELHIGDKVIYINARYGGGYQLCHGVIDRFEAEYHAYDSTTSVFTIVKNLESLTQESKIANPKEFIFKVEKLSKEKRMVTLGSLLEALNSVEDKKKVYPIGFGTPDSWRGRYDEVAFTPEKDITVKEMLENVNKALEDIFLWAGRWYL